MQEPSSVKKRLTLHTLHTPSRKGPTSSVKSAATLQRRRATWRPFCLMNTAGPGCHQCDDCAEIQNDNNVTLHPQIVRVVLCQLPHQTQATP